MQTTITAAFHSLANAGYRIFYPILSGTPLYVIESPDGFLSKIYIRRASRQADSSSPVFTLSQAQRSSIVSNDISYLLVCEPSSLISWLIPLTAIPAGVISFRITESFAQYKLLASTQLSQIRNSIIKEELTKILTGEQARQEELTLEEILAPKGAAQTETIDESPEVPTLQLPELFPTLPDS